MTYDDVNFASLLIPQRSVGRDFIIVLLVFKKLTVLNQCKIFYVALQNEVLHARLACKIPSNQICIQ